MSTRVQLRRGTTAQHSTFTGANAEVTVDTDKKTIVVHDGATAGGFPVALKSDVASIPSPSSGDAGKQLYVKGDESGYALYLRSGVEIAVFNPHADGTTDDRGILAGADAVTNTLIIGPGMSLRVASDITLSSNIVFAGGSLVPDTGVTVTFCGEVDGPLVGCLLGSGAFSFSRKNIDIYPEWFGAVGGATVADAVTDDAGSVQRTFNAIAASIGVKRFIVSQYYLLNSQVFIPDGSYEIAGFGLSACGFISNNSDGCLSYISSDISYPKKVLNIHDFGFVAKDNGTTGTDRGHCLYASWPDASDIEPSFLCRNIEWRSETYTAADATHGYFSHGLQIRHANMCHVENVNGLQIDSTLCRHMTFDNLPSANGGDGNSDQYGLHISKPNLQGGYSGIEVLGSFQEVDIDIYGLDTQQHCIIIDSTNGANVPETVLKIRNGDLNAVLRPISVVGYKWVNITDVNAAIFGVSDSPAAYDVVVINACNNVIVKGCTIGSSNQAENKCSLRLLECVSCIVSDNTFDAGSINGIIVQQDNGTSYVPGVNIHDNTFSGGSETGIYVVSGSMHKIHDNLVFGFNTGILTQCDAAVVSDNRVLACTTAYNLNASTIQSNNN